VNVGNGSLPATSQTGQQESTAAGCFEALGFHPDAAIGVDAGPARLQGVVAPNAKLRAQVVPQGRTKTLLRCDLDDGSANAVASGKTVGVHVVAPRRIEV